MSNIGLSDVEKLIDKHRDIVDFGTKDNAVDDGWIERAEGILGLKLTSSYKAFLKNYVGGEIGSEEIYSIYGIDFETVCGGDIVYQNLTSMKNGTAKPGQLVVSETDFGEVFYFDYSQYEEGECPIYLRLPSGKSCYYANNFYEFLCKRIEVHSS
ncbi:TPA: SMI1/KNR4 family protein [Escherichia coli]|uniref:SMI1/KNR4 family protein n=1 Tax=Escherichia coli TaxID=562 RepID=UPI000BB7B088|nr:SMI1/KNR4 family protein [Escherichia coli]EFB6343191.1 SMI1/KNR4 family protein [Escherichia coli]EFB8888547.1 SMI1/KNR4 family protein [Escherichia coli]EFC2190942.1 SMI1/KNR4 family protein [Escherichia coli]EFC6956920.1 SMI1/KNR4 family protein [Escherichia coli]EFD5023844.1 SMI1/KNR4 family protein [Escherichia coli]